MHQSPIPLSIVLSAVLTATAFAGEPDDLLSDPAEDAQAHTEIMGTQAQTVSPPVAAPPDARRRPPRGVRRRRHMASLSDEQKASLRARRQQRWASLSDAQKADLRARRQQRWASLSDAQKADLRARILARREASTTNP